MGEELLQDKTVEDRNSRVNHPDHYNLLPARCETCGNKIECITVVRHLSFNIGNVIKYLWRAGLKGDRIEDLKKARWYLDDEIKKLESEERVKTTVEKLMKIEKI